MEMTTKEYLQLIEDIKEHLPGYVAPHETMILTLTVRDYYNFREIFKYEYIYFGYTHERVVIAAKKYLLQTIGYGLAY
jgi:hypothetical protein